MPPPPRAHRGGRRLSSSPRPRVHLRPLPLGSSTASSASLHVDGSGRGHWESKSRRCGRRSSAPHTRLLARSSAGRALGGRFRRPALAGSRCPAPVRAPPRPEHPSFSAGLPPSISTACRRIRPAPRRAHTPAGREDGRDANGLWRSPLRSRPPLPSPSRRGPSRRGRSRRGELSVWSRRSRKECRWGGRGHLAGS